MNEALPKSWAVTTLGDVVDVLDARRVPVNADERATRVGPYPYYGANGQVGTIDSYLFDGDYALLAEDGGHFDDPGRGVAYRAVGKFWVNNHAHILAPRLGMPTPFLVSALNSMSWMPHVSGTTRPKLTQAAMVRVPFALPPLNEQRRIVGKLDMLHAGSRRARAALDAVPPLLEKLRQSILAAAFRGDLTADWRAKHPDVEPASALLARIRAERRARWEAAELAKLAAKGKPPADDKWKSRYDEPVRIDVDKQSPLPAGWTWASLDELIIDGPTNGYSPKSEADGAGTRTLRLSATTQGRCVLDAKTTKRTQVAVDPDEPYWLVPDDLLIQRSNTLDYVGTAAVFDGPASTYIYPDLMMRVRSSPLLPVTYLWRALSAQGARNHMRERATGTAGNMPKVNSQTVRSIPVPVAPAREIEVLLQLVAAAEDQRIVVQSLHADVIEKAHQLERAVLAKAFRGELVPQDPNDEPAAEMLARLRASHIEEPTRVKVPRKKARG